jgi:hypothetical protein
MHRSILLLVFAVVTKAASAFLRSAPSSANKQDTIRTALSALTRRQVGELAFAATGLGITYAGTREVEPTDYGLWGILPVGTYKKKKTIRETIVPNQLWTMDQKFGILNVQVPLRMTLVKLSTGGLLVYNPIAATPECLALVQEIVDQHGPIQHIIVGSVALEHKAYAGVFSQKFENAQVWLTPGQYSVPVNLPISFLGFPSRRTKMLSEQALLDELKDDFDIAILGPIISRDGAFAETVLLHKPTKTLLVTDTCLQVTDEIPAIYDSDHAPLLYHARDTITDVVEDTPDTLRKGWQRIVLFGLFFTPSAIRITDAGTAIRERRSDINSDFAGVYPWAWADRGQEEKSWKSLTGTKNKPLVAPILQTLLLNRSPVEVLEFADKVAAWDFNRIIPAHLKNNLQFNGRDYRGTFGFLEEKGVPEGFPKPLKEDLQLLLDAEVSLMKSGAIAPAPSKVGGSVSRAEILQQTTYRCRDGVCAPRAQA